MKHKGLELLNTQAQCMHGWHKGPRCPKTSLDDPLDYYIPGQLGRYCQEHGKQHPLAIKANET